MSENIKKTDTPIITKATIKRIVDDVKNLIKEPLHDIGIFYQHDEDDMLNGHAMIIGPEDTCYEYGMYFFKFNFPHDYPFRPPKVEYLTNDGATRFHPNLYRDGKVCLSVLNTWKGEGWSSCQSISSILIILQSILNDTPLLHEPGITKMHPDFEKYNKIITFRNFEFSILAQSTIAARTINSTHKWIKVFKSDIIQHLEKNKYKIRDRLILHKTDFEEKQSITTAVYHLAVKIDYDSLIKKWIKIQKIPASDTDVNTEVVTQSDKKISKKKTVNKILNNKNL